MSKERIDALFLILNKIDDWRAEVVEEIEELEN